MPNRDPNEILKEVCAAVNITIKDEDISTVHHLPDSKKQKNRLIAKFARREVKDKVYHNRRKMVGKTTKSLKCCQQLQSRPFKIYSSESPTKARKLYSIKSANSRRTMTINLY